MRGVYQHCGEQHLHRYLAEFEFRYNTRQANGFDDRARSVEAVKGISLVCTYDNAPDSWSGALFSLAGM